MQHLLDRRPRPLSAGVRFSRFSRFSDIMYFSESISLFVSRDRSASVKHYFILANPEGEKTPAVSDEFVWLSPKPTRSSTFPPNVLRKNISNNAFVQWSCSDRTDRCHYMFSLHYVQWFQVHAHGSFFAIVFTLFTNNTTIHLGRSKKTIQYIFVVVS